LRFLKLDLAAHKHRCNMLTFGWAQKLVSGASLL
jgi:hypothetical protein